MCSWEAKKDEVIMEKVSKEEHLTKKLNIFLADSTTINSKVENDNVTPTSVPI